jgi:hypothetical protein
MLHSISFLAKWVTDQKGRRLAKGGLRFGDKILIAANVRNPSTSKKIFA